MDFKNLPKYCYLMMATATLAMGATAATLTPEAALQRALGSQPRMRFSNDSRMELRLTRHNQLGQPALYVFAPANDQGFVVANANDQGEALLGWSHHPFARIGIPDGLAWWLDARSQARVTHRVEAALADIAPLCSTKWNQDEPYNDWCPDMEGGRAVTGCAATAMAQVMKVYQWPERGQGSYSHCWQYDGKEYTTTVDFAEAVYDWANMLDDYATVNYSQAEADDVAQLIYHVGVAGQMIYSPQESGTSAPAIAMGLINFFDYDASMTLESRDWYSEDDWNALVYGELAQGYPMMYCGQSDDGGHAFVCDGYQDGYFHINWGWGGQADGYFLLNDLDPISQGIGGSSGGYAFNDFQNIIYGMRPNFGTAVPKAVISLDGDLCTDHDSYQVAEDVVVTLNGELYNYTLGDLATTLALRFEEEDGTVLDIEEVEELAMAAGDGLEKLELYADGFPEGDYYITYCFLDGEEWVDVRHNADANYRLHIINDGETLTVENPQRKPTVRAEFMGYLPDDGKQNWIWTQGATYEVMCAVDSDQPWEGDVLLMILDDNLEPLIQSAPLPITIEDPDAKAIDTWTITVDVDPDYYFMFMVNEENPEAEGYDPNLPYEMLGFTIVQVEKDSSVNGIATDKANLPVQIYNLQGVLVGSFSGSDYVDLQSYPAGVYIIKAGPKVTRILKR